MLSRPLAHSAGRSCPPAQALLATSRRRGGGPFHRCYSRAGRSLRPSAWLAKRPSSRACTGAVAGPRPAAERACAGSRRRPAGSRAGAFITNGPWLRHRLADRPALQQQQLARPSAPFTSSTASVGSQLHARSGRAAPRPPTRSAPPRKKYSARFVPGGAGGSVHRAPGVELDRGRSRRRCSGRAAHDFGGGAGGARLARACRRSTVDLGASARARRSRRARGIVWRQQHREVRRRPACRRGGRLSQIWNSSSGFGRSRLEQREHLRSARCRRRRSATARRRRRSAPSRRASRSDR